jgi:hypothetical protein
VERLVVSSNCLFLVNWIFHGCPFHDRSCETDE